MWLAGGVDPEDKLSSDDRSQLMRRCGRMLRPYRRLVVSTLGLVVLWTACTLAGPAIVRYGIDVGLGERTHHGDSGALNLAVVLYIVAAVISYFVYRLQIVAIARIGENFLRDLRNRVFDHLLRMSMTFYDTQKAGVLVSRMTSDVDSMGELVQQGLAMFVTNGLLLALSFVVLFTLSWELTLVCLISLPVVILASIKFQRDSNVAYLAVRDNIGQTLSTLQEGISGVRIIQAFGRERTQTDEFTNKNRALYDAHMKSVKISAWYIPIIDFAGISTTAAVIGIGGWLVHKGSVTTGTVIAFVLYLANLFEPVQQLSQLLNIVQSAAASLHKLFGLIDTPIDLGEIPGAVDLPERGDLVVSGITFAYAGTPLGSPAVLNNVDLTIRAGERIVLVGPTGAGKSTLAKLCARLYDPTSGTISFGDVDLTRATMSSLRQRLVVVPQEGYLFDGSVADNIRIAKPSATDLDITKSLRKLGILDRFEALPDGLNTAVRERGSRLSAGERQLVSLARAALADPAVLVLDEATSSLDPGTERIVEHALEQLMADRTVIAIAHRLTTAERADRIGVVADGRLAELGTHRELLKLGGRYTALYASWSGNTLT